MIAVENLNKSYGTQILLKDVSFRINPKEKIGLIGRNGHGKTTLFRILMHEELPDSGNISCPKHYKLGIVSQKMEFSATQAIEEAALALKNKDGSELWKAEKILSGLGFSDKLMKLPPNQLSGGFQIRLNLARTLLKEPNLLLLDEPNNYLDIVSIRWLADFLRKWPGELMLITHDRTFMDSIVSHTMSIHRKRIRKIEGDTKKLYDTISQEEEIHEKTRLNDEKKQKETELFIRRFRAKARLAGMVQSRIKTLEKKQKAEPLEAIKDLAFSFTQKSFTGKYPLRTEELSFSYEKGKTLFSNLSFSANPGDRIFIIGENGKGKTTLLKILSNNLTAKTGEIKYHQNTNFNYYEQSTSEQLLHAQNTVLDEIMNSGAELARARQICGTMMFEKDDALKKIAVLSGGEKCRVLLGKLLAQPCNMLLLDEPSNHLDMASCDALLNALNSFNGAIIMITHNEMFLHALANRLIVFKDDNATLFEGSYQDFLDKNGWDEIENKKTDKKVSAPGNKKLLRKKKSELRAILAKELKPLEAKINSIESSIEKKELLLRQLNLELVEASEKNDIETIKTNSKKIKLLENEIEILFSDLELNFNQYEEKKKEFADDGY